jgi:hypothetical protein
MGSYDYGYVIDPVTLKSKWKRMTDWLYFVWQEIKNKKEKWHSPTYTYTLQTLQFYFLFLFWRGHFFTFFKYLHLTPAAALLPAAAFLPKKKTYPDSQNFGDTPLGTNFITNASTVPFNSEITADSICQFYFPTIASQLHH